MSPKLVKILSAVVFLFLASNPAISQSENGQISGQVADPQGLAIVNVTVEIVNQDTSAKREAKTDETGHYAVAGLAGGRYRVAVEAQGFAAFLSEDITLAPEQSLVFDVKLTVTQEKSSVTVEGGGAGQVETSNAEVSGTISEAEVKTLGLNGRVAFQLV